MRIEIEQIKQEKQNIYLKSSEKADEIEHKTANSDYIKLNIGENNQNSNPYLQDEKTVGDISNQASLTDVDLQRDYLTVMSSCMSTEDFSKLEENGYDISNTEIKELVTVTDQIKAELLKAGVNVDGYTDSIDMEKLKEITGSETFARKLSKEMVKQDIPATAENVTEFIDAYEMQKQINYSNEGTAKYLITNQLEPTIMNLYKAQYSSGISVASQIPLAVGKKEIITMADPKIQNQIDKVVENSGIKEIDLADQEAKWMISNELPLNEDNLLLLHKLNNAQEYLSEDSCIQSILSPMGSGNKAIDAIFYETNNIYLKADKILSEVDKVTENDVKASILKYDTITLKKLFVSREKKDSLLVQDSKEIDNKKLNTTKLQIEEIRLKMTCDINIRLLKRGISIDTTELGKLVEELRAEETKEMKELFNTEENQSITTLQDYKSTNQIISEIKGFPAAVIGRVFYIPEVSLETIYSEGKQLKNTYAEANLNYEKLMTSPRKDFGDSIKTAFRNIPEILQEMELEASQANQRAVRILGYNQTEVTIENIEKVKMADQEVNSVLTKLVPSAVLSMVRDGFNVLKSPLTEVADYLNSIERPVSEEVEQYAKFLYQLEQNNKISEEEKQAYIGIYRLARQIEKSDGAAVGQVILQGADLSFKNLLSALRNEKASGIDAKINNETEVYVKTIEQNTSISNQIDLADQIRYQKNLASKVRMEMEKETNTEISTDEKMNFEKIIEQIQQTDSKPNESTKSETQYYRDLIEKAVTYENEVITTLTENKVPVTIYNLVAAEEFLNHKGNYYKNLYQKAQDSQGKKVLEGSFYEEVQTSKDNVEEVFQNIQEKLTDKESANAEYEKLENFSKNILNNSIHLNTSSFDIRSYALTFKQIQVCVAKAKEENYEIPVMIGDEITSIRLKIIRDEKETGNVSVSMDTDVFGRAIADFSLKENVVSGYVVCQNKEKTFKMNQVLIDFREKLSSEGLTLNMEETQVITNPVFDLDVKEQKRSENAEISSKKLYLIAKSFIYSLQNA